MRFLATADTDVGKRKNANQDSVMFKHGVSDMGEILLAIICDGMGGLSKGELASATVVREFSKWFDQELPYELEHINMQSIGNQWSGFLKNLNVRIMDYGKTLDVSMGTTFTGILFVGNQYVAVHIGDSRLYYIGSAIKQLTTDQTFVAKEISHGRMTLEQAKTDQRRNMLLQCVGASETIEPQILYGKTKDGVYMLCSDGFYHEITENEMYESLHSMHLMNQDTMHANVQYLMEQAKIRQEKDNISVILIKADGEVQRNGNHRRNH